MNGVALALCLLAPLGLAGLATLPATRRAALAAAPWAPLPALLLALYGEDGRVAAPSLLLGALFGLDDTARTFLFFTALLWTIAGVYARGYLAEDSHCARFFVFFLATAAGNLGVVVAQDIASFYLFFALMTFAAYGLIVHDATPAARRAGRVYLVMAVLGETLLLAGFFLLYDAAGTLDLARAPGRAAGASTATATAAFLLAGFGIKVGAWLLHLWLPLAHPVAPTPASAVLSGAIIKAGLYGWLRFLPLGSDALPEIGALVIGAGLLAAFYAAAVGIVQHDAKTVLAYSSISQMGLMTVGVGAALILPASAALLVAAVSFYALHHALAKGALFLGVGVARGARPAHRNRVLVGLLLPAAALAGAPLTSGALAKVHLKQGLEPLESLGWLGPALSLAAVGTTLLMARFLVVLAEEAKRSRARHPGLAMPWLASLALVALAFGGLPVALPAEVWAYAWKGTTLVDALWPMLAGIAGAFVAWRVHVSAPAIPPGDLIVPLERALGPARSAWTALRARIAWPPSVPAPRAQPGSVVARLERRLRALPIVGSALLLLLGLFAVLLALT